MRLERRSAWTLLLVVGCCLVLVASAYAATNASISHWVLGAGGGGGSGSGVSVNGTIGQWTSGRHTSGGSDLTSGYWSPQTSQVTPPPYAYELFLPLAER